MKEAFVYSWRNKTSDKLYVGWHKGDVSDGYICSQEALRDEIKQAPDNFERFIIAHGSSTDMVSLEKAILTTVDARNSLEFYNNSNGGGAHAVGHSLKSKLKISRNRTGITKGIPKSEATKANMRKPKSPEAIANMRIAAKERANRPEMKNLAAQRAIQQMKHRQRDVSGRIIKGLI